MLMLSMPSFTKNNTKGLNKVDFFINDMNYRQKIVNSMRLRNTEKTVKQLTGS